MRCNLAVGVASNGFGKNSGRSFQAMEKHLQTLATLPAAPLSAKEKARQLGQLAKSMGAIPR